MDFSRAATCRRIGNETSPKLTNPFHTVEATQHLPGLDRAPGDMFRNRTGGGEIGHLGASGLEQRAREVARSMDPRLHRNTRPNILQAGRSAGREKTS